MPLLTPELLATRPAPDEYAPFYARYVAAVPDGDVLETLDRQLEEMVTLLEGFGEARAGHRYAEGKWSVKQVLGHVIDTERIFAYRALCAARGEAAALPGFDENAYVAQADFDARTLGSLLGELTAVRRATLSLFRNLGEDALLRRVTANGVPVSVRALAWMLAGHERHHLVLFRERYA